MHSALEIDDDNNTSNNNGKDNSDNRTLIAAVDARERQGEGEGEGLRSLSRSPRPYRRTQSPQIEPKPVGIRRWSMHDVRAEEEKAKAKARVEERVEEMEGEKEGGKGEEEDEVKNGINKTGGRGGGAARLDLQPCPPSIRVTPLSPVSSTSATLSSQIPNLTPSLSPSPPPSATPSPSSQSPKTVLWALRNQSSFGSESGTEADDELPRKLPAPPRRNTSKGLLGAGEEVEEEDGGELTGGTTGERDGVDDSRSEMGGRRRRGKSSREGNKGLLQVGGEGVDDAGGGAKRRRKKIAFVRRGVEVALMGGVIGVALTGRRRDGGEGRVWQVVLGAYGLETFSWCFAFFGVLAAYPLIIISRKIVSLYGRNFSSPQSSNPLPSQTFSLSSSIQLPRSIDPAPLLYPIFFPLAVSISITPSVFLQNLILTLAALPPRLFPVDFPYQWIISLFPILIPTITSSFMDIQTPATTLDREFTEILSYLPLIQTTLIDVLTYTLQPSLTMTEIRLLSTGLLNLLISSTTPQSIILKSLLWIGGFGVMLGCSDLITWGVQLARIPRHRFKRAGEVVRSIGRFSGNLLRKGKRSEYASSADEGDYVEETQSFFGRKRGSSTTTTADSGTVAFKCVDSDKNRFPVSIVLRPPPTSTNVTPSPEASLPLPSTTATASITAARKRALSTPSPLAWATSLTHRQAQRRKYIYAASVYSIVLSLVFFAIRPYLATNAFHGLDPFPWAASYLFCGLPGYSDISSSLSSFFGYPLSTGEGWTGCTPWYNNEWTDPTASASSTSAPTSTSTSTPAFRFSSYQTPEDIANRRLYIVLYWAIIFILGITLVLSPISSSFEVDTRRKIFHGMVVGMFLLVGVVDPPFTHLAMSLVLAVFGLADVLRAGQLPPVSKPLSGFLAPFVDGRDLKGPVVVSHFFLLVGGAVGGWFSIAAAASSVSGAVSVEKTGEGQGTEVIIATKARELGFLAGVVCVGLGDSAASLVGRRFGKTKWGWAGGKSLEGSVAFMGAVGVGLTVARWWLGKLSGAAGVGCVWGLAEWAKLWGAAAGAAMLEAVVTGVNDNVVVPIGMWVVVRGLGL